MVSLSISKVITGAGLRLQASGGARGGRLRGRTAVRPYVNRATAPMYVTLTSCMSAGAWPYWTRCRCPKPLQNGSPPPKSIWASFKTHPNFSVRTHAVQEVIQTHGWKPTGMLLEDRFARVRGKI